MVHDPQPVSEPDRAEEQRRRLDRVFGEVLPQSTSDDRGEADDEHVDADYLRDVPPHHSRP
ncbi:MAG: hypothetical protein AVDCRST_MAG21-959 [uncultured Nocardioidaceae bacterium]|uniref:Uncharacterized protein n=1 Tax=uncultured Nocardioidaceae bacterium TaxID=253824 RepID=A0A6J4N489_9ACTN|nr:MAG: hypothetical protein AVDCRST_MAG21-959 [uncultured Nocardioidaceae bacterium]